MGPRSRGEFQVRFQDGRALFDRYFFEQNLRAPAASNECYPVCGPYIFHPLRIFTQHGYQVALPI